MITQFDHILQSSFYLWFEHILNLQGEAYKSMEIDFQGGPEGPRPPSNDSTFSPNIPEGMVAYYSPFRQFVASEDLELDTIIGTPPLVSPSPRRQKRILINGEYELELPDAINNEDQIIVDYKEARILLDKEKYGQNAQVSGHFNVKTFNTYLTTEDEESILLNSDFLIQNASLKTYLESKNRLGEKSYTVPAAFIANTMSVNNPFAFGGLEETESTITVVLVTNTNYELDFALSLFRDQTRENFPIIPYEEFPYGEYFGVKPSKRPYKYLDYCSLFGHNHSWIKSVKASKMPDRSSRKIQKDIKVGFLDFTISSVRSQIKKSYIPPEPGDEFEECIQPTPSLTESPTPTPSSTPSASPTPTPSFSPTITLTSTIISGDEFEECATSSPTETEVLPPPSPIETKGDEFDICEEWGITGFHLVESGLSQWPNKSLTDPELYSMLPLSDDPSSTKYSKFIDEIISRKDSLNGVIKDPTENSFSTPFSLPELSTQGNDWKSWQISESYNPSSDCKWELFTIIPSSLGINKFQQDGEDLDVIGQITYSYKGLLYDVKVLKSNLCEYGSTENLSFSKLST